MQSNVRTNAPASSYERAIRGFVAMRRLAKTTKEIEREDIFKTMMDTAFQRSARDRSIPIDNTYIKFYIKANVLLHQHGSIDRVLDDSTLTSKEVMWRLSELQLPENVLLQSFIHIFTPELEVFYELTKCSS